MSRPVVVCHLSTMTGWGGVERMVEDVLLHPAATGGTHHLLAPSWSPEVVAPIEAAGIEMLLLHRRSRYDPRGIAQAAAWLRRKQVTILHAYNAFANIWALALSRLAGVPVFIAGEHGTVWRTSGGLFTWTGWRSEQRRPSWPTPRRQRRWFSSVMALRRLRSRSSPMLSRPYRW